jgi:3-hydroxybutyrate dehydrogenase
MLKGKISIVTGSTSGIGLGVARRLSSAGSGLVLNGFGEPSQIENLRASLEREFDVPVRYHGADMSKPDQIVDLVADMSAELGRIDILVNNAGIQHTAAVTEFPPERWDAIIAINLSAAFHAIRAALPQMLERGYGRVINVASVHGLIGSPHKAAYVAAKHGVVGLTKVVALETAGTGVTANAICPGWVLTPLVEKQIAERARADAIPVQQAQQELLSEKQPSGQFVTPEQLGDLAVFLASPSGDQLTGQAIAVDGGWVAR